MLLIIFWLVNLASSTVNQTLSVGWWGQYYRYEGLVTLSALYGVYWLASTSLRPNIRRIIWVGGLINIVFLLCQWWGGYGDRLSANLGNPNFAGGFIALSAAAIGSIYWWPLFIVGIWLTGSRTAFLGLVTIFILKYLRKGKAFSILLCLSVGLGLALILPNRPVSHFDNRWVIWEKSVMAIAEKPWLGWGRENFEGAFKVQLNSSDFDLKNIRVDKAHNETLEIMVTSGIIGVAIYYLIIGLALKTLWQYRDQELVKLGWLILVAFTVMSQFNVMNINQYVFLYFALGVARKYARTLKHNRSERDT